MDTTDDRLLDDLAAVVGDRHVIAPGHDQDAYVVDWRGRYRGKARAVVKPGSTQEVAGVVKLCAERGIAIVPQGGNTGMCGVPHARVVMHGHIGDGNIHIVAILDHARCKDTEATAALVREINEIVDDETAAQGGAISAEHGIGITNRGRLARVTDPLEIGLMKQIKALLDPADIMNPGKIFTDG